MNEFKGIYQNTAPQNQPPGFYRYGKNGKLNKNDKYGSVSNNEGTELIFSHPGQLVGKIEVNYDSAVLFFSEPSEIGLLQGDVYTPVLRDPLLNLSAAHPVKGKYNYDFDNRLTIVWSDNHNPIRTLTFQCLPFRLNSDLSIHADDKFKFQLLNLFPELSMPDIDLLEVLDSGGQLKTGAYSFSISYLYEDGMTTQWSPLTNWVYVPDEGLSNNTVLQVDGAEPDTPTSKAIHLSFDRLDTKFNYFYLGIVKKIGGVTTTFYIEKFKIPQDGVTELIYTGTQEEFALSLEEVIVPQIVYSRAKCLEVDRNRLIIGNLESPADYNYQPLANEIQVSWYRDNNTNIEAESLDNTWVNFTFNNPNYSYDDPYTLFYKKTFKTDEVYALYIAFLKKDGSWTPAYHIPGRAPRPGDLDTLDSISEYDIALKSTFPNARRYHIENTASNMDYSLGYWENSNEFYPNDPITWGSLANQRVRHHKMPSMSQMYKTGEGRNPSTFIEGNGIEEIGKRLFGMSVDGSDIFSYSITTLHPDTDTIVLTTPDPLAPTNVNGAWGIQSTIATRYTIDWGFKNPGSGLQLYDYVEYTLFLYKASTATITTIDSYRHKSMPASPIPGNKLVDEDGNTISDYQYSIVLDLEPGDIVYLDITDGITELTGYSLAEFASPSFTVKASSTFNNHINTVALKFSNIKIPADLRKEIQGFSIFYAERQNPSIQGQGTLDPHDNVKWNLVNQNTRRRTIEESLNTLDLAKQKVFRTTPIDVMYLRPNNVNYALAVHHIGDPIYIRYRDGQGDETRSDDYRYLSGRSYVPNTDNGLRSSAFLTVSPRYLALNTFIEEGDVTYYNIHQTSALLFTKLSNIEWELQNSETLDDHYHPVYDYKTFLYDMYFGFDNQKLVSTGKIWRLEDLPSTLLSDDTLITNTGLCFGGDTYISYWTFFQNYPITNPTTGLYEDENGDPIEAGEIITFREYQSYFVESVINGNYRHGLNIAPTDKYYPKSTDYICRPNNKFESHLFDNAYHYNFDYSSINNLVSTIPYDVQLACTTTTNKFPYRVAISDSIATESQSLNWRKFRTNNYYEMPRNKGEIWNLAMFNNELLIHLEYALYKTISRVSLETSAGVLVQGTGQLFDSDPLEIMTTELGYAGTQSQYAALTTPGGYFFVDKEQYKVFQYLGQLKEISRNGLREFFELYSTCNDNPLLFDGFHSGYDTISNRWFLTNTKHGYTVSYCVETDSWDFFHDFIPTNYINLRNRLVSSNQLDGVVDIYHHNGTPGIIYGSVKPFFIDVVFNVGGNLSKMWDHIMWNTVADLDNESYPFKKTLTHITVWNSKQHSSRIELVQKQAIDKFSNTRNKEGNWAFNQFRDLLKQHLEVDGPRPQFIENILLDYKEIPSEIDKNKPYYKKRNFISPYIIVRFEFEGTGSLSINEVETLNKQSFR